MLIWDAVKAKNLFKRNIVANERAIMLWKPQKGDVPIKIPNAIDSALFLLLPSISNIFSLKNLFSPFLRKYRYSIFWLLSIFCRRFFKIFFGKYIDF